MTHLSVQFLLSEVGSLIIQRAADRREMRFILLLHCFIFKTEKKLAGYVCCQEHTFVSA